MKMDDVRRCWWDEGLQSGISVSPLSLLQRQCAALGTASQPKSHAPEGHSLSFFLPLSHSTASTCPRPCAPVGCRVCC